MEDRVKESYVVNVPGHKNSKGESAPWVIKSHETGKILSSHKTESEAKSHLQDMHAHKGGYFPFEGLKGLSELLKDRNNEKAKAR
ncbi:MAG TPA: hypothetical protein P5136_02745 [Methanofastidiosum sp.]|nr:hypothetical protein [Methanofastidiosum sp.]